MESLNSKTYFSESNKPFPRVDVCTCKLKTAEFLNASINLVKLLGGLGKVFALPNRDMSHNIDKIFTKYNEDPVKYEYVEDMLLFEKNDGKMYVAESLLWLRRGLHFILEIFESLVNDTTCQENLREFVRLSYTKTLERYHGWFGRHIFKVLVGLFPERKHILKAVALDKENCDVFALQDIKEFIVPLRVCIEHLIDFYQKE